MKQKIAIYLAGSIQKGHENHLDSYWTKEHINFLKSALSHYDVSFLNPAFRSDDLSDQLSVFGRDMLQVFCSDFVFVDARDRRGLGVGAEMMWAKLHKIPLVTWAPKETHYHKSQTTILGVSVENFVHPFVESLSDKIVETLGQGAAWMDHVRSDPSFAPKDIEFIHRAMEYYTKNQLHHDLPMNEMVLASEKLKNRLEIFS